MKKKDKKIKKEEAPKVNQELDGFNIKINSAGEIEYTHSMDDINKFLNRNVDDKKLRNRDDIDK